ncbi:metallophosphoesterase family protein [Roseateles paludis]|jgi:predicted phosphodiesterase|uniref:Metallophosphoesterase n=1 Tax=Roseateles paludis TaxID=3145238 RepID=A0ABV0FZN0_9BURK
MPHLRLALVSDIHGNLPALVAVMADIQRQGVDQVIQLGDMASGPLLPRETVDLLRAQPWIHLRGNHERQVYDYKPSPGGASDAHAVAELRPDQLDWFRSLPHCLAVSDELLACHATPHSDLHYLLETVTPQGLRAATQDEIAQRLGDVRCPVIACGHSHLPRVVQLPGGGLIVNPGSVGLQAYDDDQPWPHVVETGSPAARYALIERGASGWRAELRHVDYDFEPMAQLTAQRGRPDWAVALRTGRMKEL